MTTTQRTPQAERARSSRHETLQPPVSARDHMLGSPDAIVSLVEYGDYQCPFCARAHHAVHSLRVALGARMRFVFRHFPLTRVHPDALNAAAAAESVAASAGPQAFWRMHDLLFEHEEDSAHSLETHHLVQYAATAGADVSQVIFDLDHGTYVERVREDFMSGLRSGVTGTPTFFINGERFDGDWSDVHGFTLKLRRAARVR